MTTQIQEAYDSNRRVYGSPRIHAELINGDVHVGRKRIARLMRQAGIVGCHRRKHKLGITKQNPNAVVAPPDLVDRKFTATAPNQLWVADVERHEALLNRVEVGDLDGRVVVATW